MISYEFYKFLHLGFIFLVISFFYSKKPLTKTEKFARYLSYFFIFVAGMGLIARLGFKHSEPFPLWIKLKFFMLFILTLINYAKWSEKISSKVSSKVIDTLFFMALLFTLVVVQSKWI